MVVVFDRLFKVSGLEEASLMVHRNDMVPIQTRNKEPCGSLSKYIMDLLLGLIFLYYSVDSRVLLLVRLISLLIVNL